MSICKPFWALAEGLTKTNLVGLLKHNLHAVKLQTQGFSFRLVLWDFLSEQSALTLTELLTRTYMNIHNRWRLCLHLLWEKEKCHKT